MYVLAHTAMTLTLPYVSAVNKEPLVFTLERSLNNALSAPRSNVTNTKATSI